MKNIKISGGQLIDRNDGSVVDNIHGILTSAAIECSENGGCHLHLVLTDGENQSGLRVKYPGDAALKILRCLYGAVAYIKESPVTILMRREEGHTKASIVVMHGDAELMPAGSMPTYGDLRNAMSDRLLRTIQGALTATFPVAVVTADHDLDEPDTEEVVDMVEANQAGVNVVVHAFSRPDLAEAFISGVRVVPGGRAWATQDPEVVERINEILANREAAAAAPAEGATVVDPEDNEEA